jgi:hypothetical protein
LTYVLAIEQPLDHAHPEKGNFKEQVILKYTGFAKPVVMEIEGYYGGKHGNAGFCTIIRRNDRPESRYYCFKK